MSRRRPVHLIATGIARGPGREDLEDLFGGRWNRRRPVADEARPLLEAVVAAVSAAGWWEPGREEPLAGGLVVGVDLHAVEPTHRFGRALRDGATVRPRDFLFALPSSAAAVVGVALGLRRYQATIAEGGIAGLRAVAHAADQLGAGRLSRAVAAGLTFVGEETLADLRAAGLAGEDDGPFALAAAWCLTTEAGARSIARVDEPHITEDELDTAAALDDVPAAYRHLAAPSLLAAERLLDPRGTPVRHRDPVLGTSEVLHATRSDDGDR